MWQANTWQAAKSESIPMSSHTPFAGVISSVVAQEKARKHLGVRVNVFIDDRFSFALDGALAMRHGLRPKLEITAQKLDELLREDGDARAYARALHYLSYRLRSENEVRDRLKRDEWPEAVIDRVVARLRESGLTNDAGFAAAYVADRSRARPRGARALQYELKGKGLDRETIAQAMPDAEQEIELAMKAAQSRMRQVQNLDERERREKLLGFLQRRGFNFSTSRAALQRLQELEELEEDA